MTARRAAWLAIGLLFAAGAGVLWTVPAPPGPPRLVVLVSIDQLRADHLERFEPLYEGGFKTLLERGARFTNARYRHALTYTANGHATIATGLFPSSMGITANSWFDPQRRQPVNCVFDPRETAVGGDGAQASPRSLLADTLGDRLKERNPASRVVSLSLKDRAAILTAGRRADGVYWFSPACGCFVTSSYYAEEIPDWLAGFQRSTPADRILDRRWTRLLDAPALYEKFARADGFPGEAGGRRNTFPHETRGESPSTRFYREAMLTPWADELLLEAALAAVEGHELGADHAPDLLAVSFSTTDRIGHMFGPFSQEAMDMHLRLDRLLARLLDFLDDRAGLDETLVVLTSDHGAVPLVEYSQQQGRDAERIPPEAILNLVRGAVKERHPELGDWIGYYDPPQIYIDLAALDEAGVLRADVERIAKQALIEADFVDNVYTHADLEGEPPEDDPYWELFRNTCYERRCPHLLVRLKKYYFAEGAQGSAGHGTPYGYDRHVPLIFLGAGARRGVYEAPCAPSDIAPTLGRLLHIKMPGEPGGRLLKEMLP